MEKQERVDLIVVGGGAAGFYGAIQAAEALPDIRVIILEKSNKVLSKVKISGGGRCNVTHNCPDPIALSHHYPRGEKFLKKLFRVYNTTHVRQWFEDHGVSLKTEEDGRMFPVTDDSGTIIACLMRCALEAGVSIKMGEGVTSIQASHKGYEVRCASGNSFSSKKVLITTGGNSSPRFYDWLSDLSHRIVPPVPSLFTFNDSGKQFADLMGVSVPHAEVRIAGTNLSQTGPLLITHWGLSGPAVIRLSAWAATRLHQLGYQFTALVSWIGPAKEDDVRSFLAEQQQARRKQKVSTSPLYGLPQRLWQRLCQVAVIEEGRVWSELPKKNLNRLLENLIRCPFQIRGKTTFKDEFVTCGGVDLAEVDSATMESRRMPGIFFAGEVLDIDGETGGFNFQAAWTTSFMAAQAIVASLRPLQVSRK